MPRKDRELPKCTKSNTDNDDPTRLTPNIDTEEAHLKTDRNDRELPTWTPSRSDNDDAT
jgi:hypothetical protein